MVASPPPRKRAVLGLGNRLRGDDGVGAAVIEALGSMAGITVCADLIEAGTPGLETVLLLQGYEQVIIVDAAEMGLPPGEWRRFTPDTAALQTSHIPAATLHEAGLAEALELGAALGALPASLVIYGVQPAAVDWQPGLSAPVEGAVGQVCAAVAAEIARGCGAAAVPGATAGSQDGGL